MANDSYFNASQVSTQELRNTQELDEISDETEFWGRLLPLKPNLHVYNLSNDTYSFGRNKSDTDFTFTDQHFDNKVLSVLSKLHFKIHRRLDGNENVITLEDCSSNGTFVNGTLIGKHKQKVLQNNDEISIANIKIFIFYDCINNDESQFPPEVTEKYTLCRVLGSGNFGQVRLAYRQGTLERVAIKILKKSNFSSSGAELRFNSSMIENEINLQTSINHRCIIKLIDLIESENRIFIVMELAEGGDLFSRIELSGSGLKEPIAKIFTYQVLLALSYLHEKRITHRDIKLENILLHSDKDQTIAKLTDFGLSKLAENASLMSTFCGTQSYLAPELLDPHTKGYTSKVDMWSVGVMLYASLVAQMPFFDKDSLQYRLNILNAKYSFNHPKWVMVTECAKDLITKLLVVNADDRLSADEALKHPWFEDHEMKTIVDGLHRSQMDSPSNGHTRGSPNKRPLTEDSQGEGESDYKTPKLMSGLEFLANP